MAMSLSHESAKIHQFPSGGRAARDDRRSRETTSPLGQSMPRVSETICSGSWYHEEAIQEERRGSER
jgi:hypothetical protein